MLQVWCFHFIFSFIGKFPLPLVWMNKLRDLKTYVDFFQSPMKCADSGSVWFFLRRQSDVKHLPATAAGAALCSFSLSSWHATRQLTLSQICFSQPEAKLIRFRRHFPLPVAFLDSLSYFFFVCLFLTVSKTLFYLLLLKARHHFTRSVERTLPVSFHLVNFCLCSHDLPGSNVEPWVRKWNYWVYGPL